MVILSLISPGDVNVRCDPSELSSKGIMSGPKLPFMCLDSFQINSIFFFSFLLTLSFKLFYFLVSLLLIFLVGLSKEISESCGARMAF